MTPEQRAREIVEKTFGDIKQEWAAGYNEESAIDRVLHRRLPHLIASALRDQIEECAKVADREHRSEMQWAHSYIANNDTARHFKALGGADAATDIARDIRSLKGPA